jgi:putative transposase
VRPRRLDHFDYLGPQRYFVTWCTDRRREIFFDEDAARVGVVEILRTAHERGFDVIAYCFMPDHVHALAAGTREDSNFRRFAKVARQRLAIAIKKIVGGTVWQEGFYERTLRDEESTLDVIAYILQNPVRRGLVSHPLDYKWSGSSVVDLPNLLDAVAWRPERSSRN